MGDETLGPMYWRQVELYQGGVSPPSHGDDGGGEVLRSDTCGCTIPNAVLFLHSNSQR